MTGRVLVVDDIEVNVKLLEAKLSTEYYQVISAENGFLALELARTQSPDIILLDVMMPGMDGFEVCRRLKDDAATSHIPVVMVTALSEASARIRGLQSGADDFLTKPVRDIPLFARVRSLIRLKLLMDVWRVREETSSRLGFFTRSPAFGQENADGGRVLLIIDDPYDRQDLERALRDDGHLTTVFETVEDGVAAAETNRFEMIIIDLDLRGGDVLRFCGRIRSQADDGARATPILLFAGGGAEDLRYVAKGLDLGVNDYLLKPVDTQELLARVRTQLRRRRYQDRLRANYEESITLASTDALTGVYNRRYLDTHLDQLMERAAAGAKPLSIAFCDIDHFKALNDANGHAAGDQVLKHCAQRLMRNLRQFDLVARIGGEEFVIVMPDTPPELASRVAERLRHLVAEEPFHAENGAVHAITVSIGVATNRPDDRSASDLMGRADDAMYRAKRAGRNCVVIAETAAS